MLCRISIILAEFIIPVVDERDLLRQSGLAVGALGLLQVRLGKLRFEPVELKQLRLPVFTAGLQEA